jgi:hypothetical protein
MSDAVYTPDVIEILDLFYAEDGYEPDWAVIRTRLYGMTDSHYSVIIGLLRAFFAIYEDKANFETILYRLKQELPE